MHEVALSQQLAGVVSRAAKGRTVRVVHVRIGAMRQVVPATLKYTWQFVIKGTELETAELEIEETPLIVECEEGHLSQLDDLFGGMDCYRCHKPARIVGGNEFTVVDLEVDENEE